MTIRNEFQVHILNDDGVAKAKAIAEIYTTALDALDKLVPDSRERSLMVTTMQESAFWAKRGIAVDPNNQLGAA